MQKIALDGELSCIIISIAAVITNTLSVCGCFSHSLTLSILFLTLSPSLSLSPPYSSFLSLSLFPTSLQLFHFVLSYLILSYLIFSAMDKARREDWARLDQEEEHRLNLKTLSDLSGTYVHYHTLYLMNASERILSWNLSFVSFIIHFLIYLIIYFIILQHARLLYE